MDFLGRLDVCQCAIVVKRIFFIRPDLVEIVSFGKLFCKVVCRLKKSYGFQTSNAKAIRKKNSKEQSQIAMKFFSNQRGPKVIYQC